MHHVEHLRTPLHAGYDVIVAGGGAAGLIAAVSAQRAGASTLLIEHAGCLGGTGTYGMVAQWIGFFNGRRKVVGGIADELARAVVALGGSEGFKPYVMAEASASPIHMVHFPFNPEIVKIACDRMLEASGAATERPGCVSGPVKPGDAIEIETAGGGGYGRAAPENR